LQYYLTKKYLSSVASFKFNEETERKQNSNQNHRRMNSTCIFRIIAAKFFNKKLWVNFHLSSCISNAFV